MPPARRCTPWCSPRICAGTSRPATTTPSTRASSPTFLAHVDVVVSVHGYGGLRGSDDRWTTILVGGSNRVLASDLAGVLGAALPHYRFLDDMELIPTELRGVHSANPVNRARRGGVQIELPPRIRGSGRRAGPGVGARVVRSFNR